MALYSLCYGGDKRPGFDSSQSYPFFLPSRTRLAQVPTVKVGRVGGDNQREPFWYGQNRDKMIVVESLTGAKRLAISHCLRQSGLCFALGMLLTEPEEIGFD